jgi:choline kinase
MRTTQLPHYIPLAMYNRVRTTTPMADKIFSKDAFETALQSLIRDCAKEFRKHYGNKHRLAFVCDEGPSSHLISDDLQEPQAAQCGLLQFNRHIDLWR